MLNRKYNKEDICKYVDGEAFWILNITKKILNDDRWYTPKDFLVISHVRNDKDGLGWYFQLLKKENIPTYEKKRMEEKKDELASTS